MSVIIPVYQVERYVADCLDSVLAQTYAHLDVVVVDDGSTDGSAAIVAGYAQRDDRVRVIRQDNAGLGAARNTGIQHARGQFVTFLDSDDTVPPSSYATMVDALVSSGSDFVVGALLKQINGEYRVPGWMVPLHRTRRTGVCIDEVPEMLPNIFAWNKMFRRTFWDRAALAFPHGVSYEDHVPMTTALLSARCFDVLPDVVYRWRTRDDDSLSITQRKHEVRNVADAVATKQAVCEVVDARASADVRTLWHRKMFNDLRPYLHEIPSGSEAYWHTLHHGVADLLARVTADDRAAVETRLRVLCWLTAQGRRADVERVLARFEDLAAPALLQRIDDRDVLGIHDVVDDIPDDLLDLSPTDRNVRVRLVSVRTDGSQVVIRGVGQVIGLPDRGVEPTVTLRLVDPTAGTQDDVATEREPMQARHRPPRPDGAPPPAGFVARIDASSWGARVLRVEVVVDVAGAVVVGPFTGRQPDAFSLVEPVVDVRWHPGPGLQLALVH
ncbi:MAG: glycosyltransferase [Actinomycetota bacterium]|nr:glycosyltransferase [Actinomycetota bacterium]